MAELKKYSAKFEATGILKTNNRTFKINTQNPSKTWTYSSMNLELDCDGQIFEVNLFDGFYPDEPYDIMRNAYGEWFKRGNYEGGRFVYDGEAQKRIKWNDRFDEEYLSTLDYGDKIRVKLSQDPAVEFITRYDLVNYLKENVADGTALKILGDIAFKYTDDGKVIEELQVKQIYLAFDGTPHKFTKTVRILVDGKSEPQDDLIKLNAYVVEYIREIGGEKINQQVALPFELCINTELTPKYQIYLDKIFTAEPKRYTEIIVEYTSEKSGDIKKITLEDIINESNATTIEFEKLCGKTDEEILEKYTGNAKRAVASGDIKTVNIFKDIKGEAREIDGSIKTQLLFTLNKYKASEIYFLEDVIQEEPQVKKPLNPEKKPATPKREVSSSEIDDILNGLL